MSGCEPFQIRRSDSLSFAILALTADIEGSLSNSNYFMQTEYNNSAYLPLDNFVVK